MSEAVESSANEQHSPKVQRGRRAAVIARRGASTPELRLALEGVVVHARARTSQTTCYAWGDTELVSCTHASLPFGFVK